MASRRHAAARTSDLPPGARRIVTLGNRSVGLFNVHGEFIAVLNVCPHEMAPVCKGRLGGTTAPSLPGQLKWEREGEILYCPWHGWEFDLLTGACLTDRRRLRRFPTSVEDGMVYVDLSPGATRKQD